MPRGSWATAKARKKSAAEQPQLRGGEPDGGDQTRGDPEFTVRKTYERK